MRALQLALVSLAAGGLTAGCIEQGFGNVVDTNVGDNPDGTDTNVEGWDTATEDPYAGLGRVIGRICAPNGTTWVGGATVWIESLQGLVKDLTDSEGWFDLQGVPPGIHTVRVQTNTFSTEFLVEVFADFTTELAQQECLGTDVNIAVVTGIFDRLDIILSRLGFEYDLIEGVSGSHSAESIAFLRDPSWMEQYDIIVLNCGLGEVWDDHRAEIGPNIRSFIDNGGSMYMTDMSYYAMEMSFPNAVKWAGDESVLHAANVLLGPVVLQADVADPTFAVAIGRDQVPIAYESSGLYAAAQTVQEATPLLTASFAWQSWMTGASGWMDGAVGLRMKSGGGSMVWTSFHNEEQKPTDLDPLLEQVILSL